MLVEKKVLGIDPSFVSAGYSVLKVVGNRFSVLRFGTLSQSSKLDIPTRIGKFYDFFSQLAQEEKITHIILETPFLGKNAQTFLKLGYLRGVLNLLAVQNGYDLLEYSPREIKSAITGSGQADKEQVARALQMFFPALKLSEVKHDATDALAIGLCGGLRI